MMISPVFALLVLSSVGSVDAATKLHESAEYRANPIRKVVTMLQNMQKKIAAESKKKEEAFDKYMCYCQNADSTLGKSIADAEAKIPQVISAIDEAAASKKQLEAELKEAQVNRVAAKEAIAEAEALRAKEAKAFAKTKADADSNIGALSKAIPAIEKGMSGAFLQTAAASVLRRLSVSADMVP